MAIKKAEKTTDTVVIEPLRSVESKFRIIGTQPLFQNRMAEKAMQTLLIGGGPKNRAARAAEMKHEPVKEFYNSMELFGEDEEEPTAIGIKVVAFKKAMATAALETPGITKTSVERLIFMPGELVPLYGTPLLRMDVVRSSGMNRSPDIRTRAFFRQWGCEITVRHIIPQVPVASVVSLIANAGVIVGVGDFRQEKGAGSFGVFRVLMEGEKDKEWDHLVKHHAKAAQEKALDAPQYDSEDTEALMEEFFGEVRRRAA